MTKNQNELLTMQEAAQLLAVKLITLRKWDREGKLVAVRVGSRRDRRYRRADIDAFLNASASPQIAWQEYIRSGITFMHIAEVVVALRTGLAKHFGRGITNLMSYFEGTTLYWYYDPRDLYALGRVVTDALGASPARARSYYSALDAASARLLAFIDAHPLDNLGAADGASLAASYAEFRARMQDFYDLAIAIDATDESLMKDITETLERVMRVKLGAAYSTKVFVEAYNALTTPTALSYVNMERKAVLEIASEVKRGSLSIGDPTHASRIEALRGAYWWTGLGWGRAEGKTTEDVCRSVDEACEHMSVAAMTAELSAIATHEADVRAAKKKMIAAYVLERDVQLIEWLDTFDALAAYHDLRKEVQVKAVFWQYRFIDEIARRRGVPAHLLTWALADELEACIVKGVSNEHELNQRSTKFLYLHTTDVVSIWSGREAARHYERTLGKNQEEIRDLQGMGASPGKVTGEAFVAITPATAMHIQAGQVLVTGMTTPDFVPAMKKAAAIVTDEGGITCHAAIISRELGVPCVVGTKYATKVIKNGMLIEVAANHNVVRILRA